MKLNRGYPWTSLWKYWLLDARAFGTKEMMLFLMGLFPISRDVLANLKPPLLLLCIVLSLVLRKGCNPGLIPIINRKWHRREPFPNVICVKKMGPWCMWCLSPCHETWWDCRDHVSLDGSGNNSFLHISWAPIVFAVEG
jgi:hypothetical protein